MVLQAVLFDFNGTIINDEPIHRLMLDELMLGENLRPKPQIYRRLCLGKSDRTAIPDLMASQGLTVDEGQLQKLLAKKTAAYRKYLANLTEMPIYEGLRENLTAWQTAGLKLAIVTGAVGAEVDLVLDRSDLRQYFSLIIASEDVTVGKPAPEGYLLAAQRLGVEPQECLAIEDTLIGLQAAKAAQIPVVGIANTYPLHMLQRQANWAVDCFADLELERIQENYAQV
jgi:beta-phosphoglucomutase